MKNKEKYMKLALKEAKKAFINNEVPVGAIIVKNDKIISKAYNKRDSSNISIYHAEIIAIDKACKKLNNWRLIDCTIYVTLEPCPMCYGAIRQSRIKNIVYGAKNNTKNDIEINKTTKTVDKTLNIEQLLEEDCSKLIKEFFINKR